MLSPNDAVLNQMFSERGGPNGTPVVTATKAGVPVDTTLPINGTFEADVSGWTAGAATLTRSTVQARSGAASMLMTPTGAGGEKAVSNQACSPGLTVSASAWFRSKGDFEATDVLVRLRFLDASNAFVANTNGAAQTASTTGWVNGTASAVAPAGTARVEVALVAAAALGANTGSSVYVDDVAASATGSGTLDMGPSTEKVTVRRELAGDLPADVSLIGGAVTASCDLDTDLRMPGPHPAKSADRAAWLFPNVTPMTVRGALAGYGKDVPVFKGTVRTIGFDEDSNRRPIELMDRSDEMRTPVTIPYYGSYADRVKPGKVTRCPTNLTAVLVAAMHASGFRVTPAPSSDVVWSAPLVAGALAEVGWTVPQGNSIEPGDTWLTTGPYGQAPAQPSGKVFTVLGYPSNRPAVAPVASQVEFWFNRSAPTGQIAMVRLTRFLVLQILKANSTQVTVRMLDENNTVRGTSTFTPPAGWSHIAARLKFGTASTAEIAYRVNGGTETSVLTNYAASGSTPEWANVEITAIGFIQQASLHLKTSNAAASWRLAGDADFLTFTPQASLDLAALEVADMPPVDGRLAWDLCKEIASAELGMVGFSEEGVPYFRNRASLIGATTPTETWDTDLVDTIAGSASVDSVRDAATMPTTRRWQLDSGLGAETIASRAVPAYLHTEPLLLPTGRSEHLIKVPKPMVPTASLLTIPAGTNDGWPGRVYDGSSVTLCDDPTGQNRYTSTAVVATIHPVDSTTWRLVVTNGSGLARYAVWPAAWTGANYPADSGSATKQFFGLADSGSGGKSSLIIFGRVAVDDLSIKPSTVAVGAGKRLLEVNESPWLQDETAVRALLQQLLADLAAPRLVLKDITVPGDLRRQLGDRIQLVDWQNRVPPIVAKITRLHTEIGPAVPDQGISQTVSLRA